MYIGGKPALAAIALLMATGAQHVRAAEEDLSGVMAISECLGASGYDEIVAKCTAAIKSGKVNDTAIAVAYHKRAWAYQQNNEHDKAIADFTQTIALRPDYGSAFSGRAGAYFSKGEFEKAAADGTEAIKQSPQDVFAYNIRGMAQLNLKNYDGAIADLTKAIELVPGYAPYYQFRGDAYLSKGDKKSAKPDFTQCLTLDPANAACKASLAKL